MRAPWLSLGALVALAGCASVLGESDPTLEWCSQPGNVHAFCEDFDHPDPFAAWAVKPTSPPGTSRSVLPSDDSPPNMLATTVQALPAGDANLTGLETGFQGENFAHVVVALDVQVVEANFVVTDTEESGIGFLLIEDTSTAAMQPNLCIGLVLVPAMSAGTVGVALVLAPNPTDCFMVDNLMTMDGGGADDGGADPGSATSPQPVFLGNILTNAWQHVVLDVTRASSGDGSGSVLPTFAGAGAMATIPIPAGFLAPGYPQLGIATSVTGPSGNVDIQFDNVTVDFPPQ